MAVASAIVGGPLETPKSQFCCLLGSAVTATAAPARADALIVSLLVLPTHTVGYLHQLYTYQALTCDR